MFQLRFESSKIKYWAGRYDYPGDEKVEAVASENRQRGSLTTVALQMKDFEKSGSVKISHFCQPEHLEAMQ